MDAHPVSHPTDQTLTSYGLGQLDDAFARSVNAHLESCPDCRRRVAELASGSSPGRTRDAGSRPDSPAPAGYSLSGRSLLDRGGAAPAPPRAGTLPPGLAESPDYEVITELGRGGMGVVYLARNTLMGRLEVLKVVSGHHVERREVFDRFRREIRSAARLRHPNIVTAYSALQLGDSLVLAMEYAEGLDLARMVKTRGPLPVVNACYYVQQAALGLQHAHDHGMVHRDIKPANLILARERDRAVIKVLDFGLAKVSSEGEVDTSLTRVGQVLGTPDYIAPEQIRDAQSADIRADIYSLGCTFYYLLTGGPPFTGNNLWDLYQAHFSMDASPLNLVRPEVPAELAALVAKMMAKEPTDRFQTPGAVARALLPFITKGNPGPAGPRPRSPGRHRPMPDRAGPLWSEHRHGRPWRPRMHRRRSRENPRRRRCGRPRGWRCAPTAPDESPADAGRGVGPGRSERPIRDRGPTRPIIGDPPPPVAPRPQRRDLGTWSTAIATLRRSGPWAWWAAAAVVVLGLVAVGVAYLPTPPPARTMDKEIANEVMTNSIGMKFALIPAGDFEMGLAERERKSFPDAKAPHHVRIAGRFYLGVHEVTRGQFRQFVNETGHRTDAERDGKGGWGCDEKTGNAGRIRSTRGGTRDSIRTTTTRPSM